MPPPSEYLVISIFFCYSPNTLGPALTRVGVMRVIDIRGEVSPHMLASP